MIKNKASINEWRAEWYKNYIDIEDDEDERVYPMNRIVLSGRLTKDPILRKTKSDVSVCSFRVAVKRPGTKDKTDFHNCIAWRETAEFICKYFSKGKWIEVDGKLINDTYKDGETTVQTSVVSCDNAFFGGSKKEDDSPSDSADENSEDHSEKTFHDLADDDGGELPF